MPLRVGIIGSGWGCKVQVPCFRQAGLDVTALYSRDMAKAKELTTKLKIPHAFDSVHALCASNEVDIVSIVSPTYLHAEHALVALRAGKHIISDKPTAVTADEASTILAEASKRPKQVAIIDHELRFLQFTQEARNLVMAGKIGSIRHVTAQFLVNMGGFGKNFSWWHERSKGGGVSGALGVHVIDLCSFITGQKIKQVFGQAKTFVTEKSVKGSKTTQTATADDTFSIIGSFEGGAAVNIVVSGVSQAKPQRSIVIMGDAGSLVVDVDAACTTLFDAKGKQASEIKEDMQMPEAFMQGTLRLAAAVAESGGNSDAPCLQPACRVADGVYVQSVIDAMLKSSDSGSIVQVTYGSSSRL